MRPDSWVHVPKLVQHAAVEIDTTQAVWVISAVNADTSVIVWKLNPKLRSVHLALITKAFGVFQQILPSDVFGLVKLWRDISEAWVRLNAARSLFD